jgi:hypothetical protein
MSFRPDRSCRESLTGRHAVFRSYRLSWRAPASTTYINNNIKSVKLDGAPEWDSAAGKDRKELDRKSAHYAVRVLATLCEGFIMPISFRVRTCWEKGVRRDDDQLATPMELVREDPAAICCQLLLAEPTGHRDGNAGPRSNALRGRPRA